MLGGDPLGPDGASLIESNVTPTGGFVLSFKRAEDSIGQVSVVVETNSDLTNPWSSFATVNAEGGGLVAIDSVPEPDAVTVTIPASRAADGRLFARIRVIQP